jgi:hypothetical protein
MNLKKVSQKIAAIRDQVGEDGKLSDSDKKELKLLVSETLEIAQKNSKKVNSKNIMPDFENIVVHNDNQELSADQTFRLRLVEKTGTGSHLIH